ncbi:MAG: hypothetical protein NVSMB27_18650 [Ktedonobacteraceae bacterium]
MSKLNLALLGTPEIRHDGQLVTFSTRKVMALLIYLAVEGGMHSREKITTLFWPESDTTRGRGSLRLTLTYLRDALGGESAKDHAHMHLIAERDALSFDFRSPHELDVHTLQTAFKQTRTNANAENLQEATRRTLFSQWQTAVGQYRSNFLDGFSLSDAPDFDDWIRLQREAWHQRMTTVLDRLLQVQFDAGELPGAIDTAHRWVAHDPLNEIAYHRLMQVQFAAGDRNAALRAYEACRSMLAKEYHARPGTETTDLAERIRTKALSHRLVSPTFHPPSTASPLLVLSESSLIGRAMEYRTLTEIYRATQQGQARVGILKGEAGIGKTRLATEFLGWAAAQGADILQGRAFETGGNLSYQALVDALRSRMEQENAPEDLLSDVWLAELSRLLPELRDRYPDLPLPTADETTARIRLLEAVVRLGQVLADRRPVVLFIDDLQWADAASLDALHYAGRRWKEGKTPLLLLLSVRAETLNSAQGLAQWLIGLEHELQALSLELESLTCEDILQLVAMMAQEKPREASDRHSAVVEEFGQWLFHETRGQPFYVLEMLKALLERGVLASSFSSEGKWVIDFSGAATTTANVPGLIPSTVRELIRSRLAHLPANAVALLTAGAVLGHDFTFEQACRIADLGENDGLLALDELLVSRQLAQSATQEREMYFFTHDRVRDVVYTEAGDTRRRVFHRRALEVLQAGSDHEGHHYRTSSAELAHHAHAAGLKEAAFHLSLAAGDEALRLFAVRNAIEQFEQAQQVMMSVNSEAQFVTASIRYHLSAQLGRAYELQSEFEQAHAVYAALLAFAQEAGEPTIQCVALNRLATLAAQNPSNLDGATALLHQALSIAGQNEDTGGLAETEWNLAQVGFYRFDASLALAHGERALVLARKLGLQEIIARSLNVVTYAHLLKGDWEKAEAAASEAAGLYQGLGNRAMESDSFCQVAYARINSGRAQSAIQSARDAFAISTEIGNAWGQSTCAMHLAVGFMERGMYTDALAFAQQAEAILRTHSIPVFPGIGLTILGRVRRAMHGLDAAHSTHQAALETGQASGLDSLIELYAAELCADCALAENWESAHTYALKALDHRGNDLYLFKGLIHWYQTEALLKAGDIARALEDVQHFGMRIGGSRRHRIPYLRSLAVLAKYQGEIEMAMGHMHEAVLLSEEMGLPGESWSIEAALGDLHQSRGEKSHAQAAFARAAEIVRALANNIQDEQQRVIFLSAQQVRHVLE